MRYGVAMAFLSACLMISSIGAIGQGATKPGTPAPDANRRLPQQIGKNTQQLYFNMITTPLPVLTAELKLSEDQNVKCKEIKERSYGELRVISMEETQADRTRMRKRMNELKIKTENELEATLDDSQKRRIPQLFKELSNLLPLHVPVEAYHDLQLTAEQKKKTDQLAVSETKERLKRMNELREAQLSGDQNRVGKAIAAMLPTTSESFISILTHAQKIVLGNYQTKRNIRKSLGEGAEISPGKP